MGGLRIGGIVGVMVFVLIGCGGDSSVYPFGDRGGSGGENDSSEKIYSVAESMKQVPGSSWKLAGFETYENGTVSMEGIPEGLDYTLTFGQDGRAGGMADCKGYDYGYELTKSGDGLKVIFVDPAPQIAMMCSNPQVDGEFYNGMQSAGSLTSTRSTLRLFYPGERDGVTRALYFVASRDESAPETSLLKFIPFSLVLHASNPYTIGYGGINGKEHEVRLEGDLLYVPVAYSGGCQEHNFHLFADNDASLVCGNGEPCPQTLHLIHTGDPDMCEAYITEERAFDLTPLKERLADQGVTSGTVELTILVLDGNGQTVTVLYDLAG